MTPLGPRPFALALVGLLAVYALGRCDGKAAADMGWHERNVATLTTHVRAQRAELAEAIAAKDTSTRRVARRSAAVDVAQDTLADVLQRAEAAIKDSAATLNTLRRELGRTASAARGLSLRADNLQAAISLDAEKHLAERAANRAVIAAQDAVIAAQRQQLKALDCRVLGMRCPSRLQSLGIGGLLVAALVLL